MTQHEGPPEALDCPRILFGPLYNTLQPGRYLYHPNFRSFAYGQRTQISNPSAAHMRAERPADVQIHELCPANFEPEMLIWSSLALLGLPLGLEECPYPTLAIVHDWHLNLQACLENAWRFDFVVGDRAFVRLLRSQGYTRCAEILNYSFQPGNHLLWPGVERCWDISFVGDTSYTHHPQRNQDLQRILKLAQKYRVFIGQHYYAQDYTRILNQSKIVVNRSVRGELNMRSFEAAACGALVFIERTNLEVDQLFRPGESCVLYDDNDLESQLAYYLEHEDARQRLAHKGMQLVHRLHTPEQHFKAVLELLPQVQAAFKKRQRLANPLTLARQLFFSHSAGAQQQALEIAQARAKTQGPRPGESILAAQFELAMGLNLCLNQPHSAGDRARLLQQATALQHRQASRWTSYYWGFAALLNGRIADAIQCWQGLYQSLQRQWLSEDEIQRFFVVPGGCGPNLSPFRQTWERDLVAFWQGQLELEDLTHRLQAQLLEGLGQLWAQQALQQAQFRACAGKPSGLCKAV